MVLSGYQCCFCSEGIDETDPLGFRVELTRLLAPDHPGHGWQVVYAHAGCLQALIRPGCDFDPQRFLDIDADPGAS